MNISGLIVRRRCRAYSLTECLVYIAAAFILLGVGAVAMQRCIDSSVLLRRNAHDIGRAVHIGEVWRADIRKAEQVVVSENSEARLVQIQTRTNRIEYRFTGGAVERRVGPGPWGQVLDRVRDSSMRAESHQGAAAWCWDLELEPTKRSGVQATRIRPLFTFVAVPEGKTQP